MTSNEFTLVIPANGVANFHVVARVFACITTTAPYTVRADNGDAVTVDNSAGFGGPDGARFSRLTFYNPTGSVITTTFYAGDAALQRDRTVTLSNATVTADSKLKNDLAECIDVTPGQFVRTVASANTAVTLTTASTKFRKAIIYAFKTAARGANAGNIYLGASGSATNQPVELFPGGEYVLECPLGNKMDFNAWYLNAPNAGDGVVVIYQ